jgi:hypothetical protein
MEGETIDLVYKTFTNMMHNEQQKNDKVEEMIKSINPIQLQNFTALQLMGLVLLKPESIKSIFATFEDKRRRLTHLNGSLKVIKISPSY